MMRKRITRWVLLGSLMLGAHGQQCTLSCGCVNGNNPVSTCSVCGVAFCNGTVGGPYYDGVYLQMHAITS